jgi:CheY-like chemotaxis protein
MRRLASTRLERIGHAPETVADGEAAVARYQEAQARGTPFAGVLIDLTVATGMGGREAMAELRRIDPDARVLVCSGYAEDNRGVADYTAFGFAGRFSQPDRLEDRRCELARLGLRREAYLGTPDITRSRPRPAGFWRGRLGCRCRTRD